MEKKSKNMLHKIGIKYKRVNPTNYNKSQIESKSLKNSTILIKEEEEE